MSALPPKADIHERGHVPANGEKRTSPELSSNAYPFSDWISPSFEQLEPCPCRPVLCLCPSTR